MCKQNPNTNFKIIDNEGNSFRRGILQTNGKRIETPVFFPVLNFMTGPPGIERNGGIWRYLKIEMIKNRKLPAIMTQIMHFADFPFSPNSWKLWFKNDGIEYTLHDWINESVGSKDYSPVLFVDSGGFKLLYNSSYDVSSYGFTASPESIYNLQMNFGADIIATLDYPFPPNISDNERQKRTKKSIDNAIKCLELLSNESRSDLPLPYLAVHGHQYNDVKKYVSSLLGEVYEKGYNKMPFGLAIGSLVPLRNHYELISEILRGVKDAINENCNNNPGSIPIHVFGISSFVMPFLAYLGVDSFDSNTYVQSAINLKYLSNDENGWGQTIFYNLREIKCDCKYCLELKNGGLENAKRILRSKPYQKFTFSGDSIYKSKIYSYIALHNLELMYKQIENIIEAQEKDNLLEYIIKYGSAKPKGLLLLKRISLYDEDLRNELKNRNFSVSVSGREREKNIGYISLRYGPEDFNINDMNFNPEKKKVLLILPCTNQKPYGKSKYHKFIFSKLEKAKIDLNQIQKVTLSGNYGPVPEQYEILEPVLNYDYMLNPNSKKRIQLLIERTSKFLFQYGDKYESIVAYMTSKPYRTIIEEAIREYNRGIVLPTELKNKRQSEFMKMKNVEDLISSIKEKITLLGV